MIYSTTHQAMRYLKKERKLLHLKELQFGNLSNKQKTFDIRPLTLTHKVVYKIDEPVRKPTYLDYTRDPIYKLIFEILGKGDAFYDNIFRYVDEYKPLRRLQPYPKNYCETHLNFLIKTKFISYYYVILDGKPHTRKFYYLL